MKVLIVEDEPLAAKKNQKILAELNSNVTVVGATDSIVSTVQWLKMNDSPDLILMDIELADGQSFEIYKHVKISSAVIFITSYCEYALKALKVHGIDYLIKPLQKTELQAALNKYEQLKEMYSSEGSKIIDIEMLLEELQQRLVVKEYRKRFLVKQGSKLLSVKVEHIAYFFSDSGLTYFKTYDNQKFVVDYSMDELEEMIDPVRFFRIGRAFYISADSTKQILDYPGHRLQLVLTPETGKEVIVSREKVTSFKHWIGK